MKKGLGIRPSPAQRHLPEDQVTEWILDSSGEYDATGAPLPRKRIVCKGRRPKAIAQRRAWLAQLAGAREEEGAAFVTTAPTPTPAATPTPTPAASPSPAAGPTHQTMPPPAIEGSAITSSKTKTFADFVRAEYLAFSKERHDESTTPGRMELLEQKVLPIVGHLTLEQANTRDTVLAQRAHLDQLRFRGGPLTSATKNQALLAFSHVLTAAVELQLLQHRVKVGLYRDKTVQPGEILILAHGFECGISRHKRFPEEEVTALFGACEDEYDYVLLGMGFFFGFRASEIAARLWADADLKMKTMKVWSQVAYTKKTKQYYIKPYPKNGVGGIYNMSDEYVSALKELRRKSTSEYILTPSQYKAPYPFLTKAALRHRFKVIAERAGVKRTTYLHGMRHTFCCQHADNGLPAHEIQILARHKTIRTTYEYIDPSTERLKRAVLQTGSFSGQIQQEHRASKADVAEDQLIAEVPETIVLHTAASSSGRPWGSDEKASDLLTTKQVAKILGMSVGGLERMRSQGRGPKFIRVGSAVRYRRGDLFEPGD